MDSFDLLGEDAPRDHARDHTDQDDGGLPLGRLESFLADLRNEPEWRAESDKQADYYDGNQLDAATLEALREHDLGPLQDNLIKPTIDSVLGIEVKTRTDWTATADDEEHADLALVISAKLKEVERETRADRAIADAYAGQLKAGFAAVEVSRNSNPHDYPYRVNYIHRREIFWDFRSQKPDWSDARYIIRKRWLDVDIAAAYFPEYADLIRLAIGKWESFGFEREFANNSNIELLQRGMDTERRSRIEDDEWRSAERRRCAIYEVWYRTYERVTTVRLNDGRVLDFDPKNKVMAAAVASGHLKPQVGVTDKMRCAYFVGPHRVADYATGKRHCPYIPFYGYREDLTGIPYGLIRQMIPMQDEINARRAKLMWLLSSRRTLVDDDALATAYNSHGDVTREVARANAYIVLNANRRNPEGIRVDDNLQQADKQTQVLAEMKAAFPQVAGVYQAMLGEPTSTTANSAMQTLIDQGAQTLAEINDNYNYARRIVGERLKELILEDLAGVPGKATVDTGVSKKTVQYNQPATDELTGEQYLQNDITKANIKIALAETPQTPSYRQQQFTMLAEVTRSLTPELQAVVAPFLLEASDLPNRKKLAKLIRDKLGMMDEDVDPNTPEGQKAAAMAQQMAQQQALQQAMAEAEVGLKQAQAQKASADAAKTMMEAQAGQVDDTPIKVAEFQHKAQVDREKLANDVQVSREKMALEREKLAAKAQLDRDSAEQKMAMEREQRGAQLELAAQGQQFEQSRAAQQDAQQADMNERQFAQQSSMAERQFRVDTTLRAADQKAKQKQAQQKAQQKAKP